ncbi:hypothetical protein PQR65_00855 [Paraburkholderia nemoris]|uniref:hypothetical protein n=1 Tax=Paraburkholderia nemoris TaxID=2793076 RepID=UPI0038B6BABA
MSGTRRWAFVLAVGATGTALCLSVLAGWQRGGSLAERQVWVAIGVVLVVSAHLLPVLIRDAPIVMRAVGSLLWGACLATACYGHVVFFVLAQQHAGEQRAMSVATVGLASPGRSLTVVMAERSDVTRQRAFSQAQRCPRDCPTLEARRVTLTAKLDALNAEADDVRRRQTADDRTTAQRDALLADPVTARFAALLGTTVARVDLLSGLLFAAILEGVACLMWTVALRLSPLPAHVTAVTQATPSTVSPVATVTDTTLPTVTPDAKVTAMTGSGVTAVTPDHHDGTVCRENVTPSHGSPTGNHAPRDDPIPPSREMRSIDDDVTRLAQDVTAGHVRPTVADIRRHLGCSQARAATLRRQLAERHVAA